MHISEEALDDWTAQSLNRNMESLLNPNKNYFIPVFFSNYRNFILKIQKNSRNYMIICALATKTPAAALRNPTQLTISLQISRKNLYKTTEILS